MVDPDGKTRVRYPMWASQTFDLPVSVTVGAAPMDYELDQFARKMSTARLATGRIPAALIDLAPPNPNIPAGLTFPTFRLARELGAKPVNLARELSLTM